MNARWIIGVAVLCVGIASPSFADDEGQKPPKASDVAKITFKKLDANGDGVLSLEEFARSVPDGVAATKAEAQADDVKRAIAEKLALAEKLAVAEKQAAAEKEKKAAAEKQAAAEKKAAAERKVSPEALAKEAAANARGQTELERLVAQEVKKAVAIEIKKLTAADSPKPVKAEAKPAPAAKETAPKETKNKAQQGAQSDKQQEGDHED